MGRSRGPRASASEDFGQKSKRKKTTSSGENLEVNATGQEKNEGKKALYHCNYCNKDISEKVRIKCVRCPDFDLCVECFSVGAEITPHKSNHPYRVMDNLSFPIICPDWNADEETLLLEGIEMCGMGNWTEVAEHVTTKSKAQCMDHYYSAYMNSPCFPLPDMSQFAGRNREELLAMAKAPGNGKTGFPPLGKLTVKEEPVFSPSSVKIEEATVGRSPSKSSADEESGVGASSSYASATTAAVKKASNKDQAKDDPNVIKVEDSLPDRSIGGKKPISSGTEGPSMAELSGYNSKRQEFDPEYDNDAEQLLADMEFNDTDTQAERELKLRVLHIYNKRLDERKRRKNFILERNLLAQDPWEKDLSHEEREIYNRYKVFMRFLPKEEYDGLTKAVIGQYRARKRIQELQEARAAGCRTSADVDRYHEHKRKKEAEESALRAKGSIQVGPSGKLTQKTSRLKAEPNLISPRGGVRGSTSSEFGGKDYQPSTTAPSASSYLEVWDITGLPGSDLLSECEKRLCEEMRMLPSQYLKMLEVMSKEIFKGSLSRKSDAHGLFKVDSSKVDRVFDMLVSKGIVPPGS